MIPLYGLGIVALIAVLLLLKPVALAQAKRFGNGRSLALGGIVAALGLASMVSPKIAAAGITLLTLLAVLSRVRFHAARPRPGQASAGSNSAVSTSWLEVYLDHDSGRMGGQVSVGEFQGRTLESMTVLELLRLRQTIEADGSEDSLRLLDTFLDQEFPEWQDKVERTGGASGSYSGGASGAMGRDEALKVLGLDDRATDDDIRAAHRRLIGAVHPDKGGSSYLAAQLNRAKEVLLGQR